MLVRLPGGICFAHGPYKDTVGCPKWPACVTDPQKPEYIAMAESQKPTPHVCPPISPEMRAKIAVEYKIWKDAPITPTTSAYVVALSWLLREADSLESQT